MRIRQVFAALTATALIGELVVLSGGAPARAAGPKAPVNVGLIYSKTGPLASYGAQYAEGFAVGLDYATHGTGMANGHKIVVTERDDGTDPAKAVAAAKELIGQGYKIVGGSTSSGAAIQLAPLAKENNVLFVSGAAASDAITGVNRNTFRSGRQTYQDVLTAGTIVGTNLRGKKVLVFAQDSTFGQANVNAVRVVLGGGGGDVSSVLAPQSANDFAPFAQKIKDAKPDLLFVAWAGATAPAMWKALDDSGVLTSTKVVTGLDQRSTYETLGAAGDEARVPVALLLPSAEEQGERRPRRRAQEAEQGSRPLLDPDGFVAAEMIVHAIEKADGDDVGKMISALEGWTFDAPKGRADGPRRRPRDAAADVRREARRTVGLAGAASAAHDSAASGLAAGAALQVSAVTETVARRGDVDRGLRLADPRRRDRRRREPDGERGRVPRHHRPERRRQDDAVQPAFRRHAPDGGAHRLRAAPTSPHAPPYVRARLGLGRTFQTSTIFAELTTLENARLAAQAYLGGSNRLWVLADRQHDALERAHAALASVGLEAARGDEGRVALARREAQARPRDPAVRRSAGGAARRADGGDRGRRRARR